MSHTVSQPMMTPLFSEQEVRQFEELFRDHLSTLYDELLSWVVNV